QTASEPVSARTWRAIALCARACAWKELYEAQCGVCHAVRVRLRVCSCGDLLLLFRHPLPENFSREFVSRAMIGIMLGDSHPESEVIEFHAWAAKLSLAPVESQQVRVGDAFYKVALLRKASTAVFAK